jgi:hypothetical protein
MAHTFDQHRLPRISCFSDRNGGGDQARTLDNFQRHHHFLYNLSATAGSIALGLGIQTYSSVCTRQIERARHDATSSEALETWFDAVTELRIAHHYPPECIYNMDESVFAVGANQSSRALVSIREKSS